MSITFLNLNQPYLKQKKTYFNIYEIIGSIEKNTERKMKKIRIPFILVTFDYCTGGHICMLTQ